MCIRDRDMGITVYAWYDCTDEEYFDFLHKALDHKTHIIIDDGGDLVNLLHTTPVSYTHLDVYKRQILDLFVV